MFSLTLETFSYCAFAISNAFFPTVLFHRVFTEGLAEMHAAKAYRGSIHPSCCCLVARPSSWRDEELRCYSARFSHTAWCHKSRNITHGYLYCNWYWVHRTMNRDAETSVWCSLLMNPDIKYYRLKRNILRHRYCRFEKAKLFPYP